MTYDYMVSNYASATPNSDPNSLGPFILPDTVDKLYRIIVSLERAAAGRLGFSFAVPAVGAIPTMVPQYGDSKAKEHGGVWWGGNLKGMMYSLVQKYGEGILRNWDLGLMTYDLGKREGNDCGNGLEFGC